MAIVYCLIKNLMFMKNLKKLTLVRLSEVELEKKDLKKLKGGGCCICGAGGNTANASANHAGDLYSPGGGYGWGY